MRICPKPLLRISPIVARLGVGGCKRKMVGEKFERGFEDEDTRVKVITEGRWEGMVALAGTSVGGEEIGGGLRCFVGFRRVF